MGGRGEVRKEEEVQKKNKTKRKKKREINDK